MLRSAVSALYGVVCPVGMPRTCRVMLVVIVALVLGGVEALRESAITDAVDAHKGPASGPQAFRGVAAPLRTMENVAGSEQHRSDALASSIASNGRDPANGTAETSSNSSTTAGRHKEVTKSLVSHPAWPFGDAARFWMHHFAVGLWLPVLYDSLAAVVSATIHATPSDLDAAHSPWNVSQLAANESERIMSDGERGRRERNRRISANETRKASTSEMLLALGAGNGFGRGEFSLTQRAKDYRLGVYFQHEAVALLIASLFFIMIATSLSVLYAQVRMKLCSTSSIRFYTEADANEALCEAADLEGFLEAFDGPPGNVRLVVTGLQEATAIEDRLIRGRSRRFRASRPLSWAGRDYVVQGRDLFRVVFSFALDLSPWILTSRAGVVSDSEEQTFGVHPEDRKLLSAFLDGNENELATVEMRKEVVWPEWQDLATNIRSRLRQLGFEGVVQINCEGSQHVVVRRNTAWAHFVHHRITKALMAASMVGWMPYLAYVWLRDTRLSVRSQHCVTAPIDEFWELVGDKLTAQGFANGEDAPTLPS